MSNAKQETIADIVAEMLEFADTDSQTVGRDILRRQIQYFARRIKQAVTDYNHLCNAAKMRESVENALDKLLLWNYTDQDTARMALGVVNKLNAEISAPPRNCDIGTAEEQAERFRRFCGTHKPDESQFTEEGELLCQSTGCELIACNYGQCALAWSQMPYEEGGVK